MDIARSDVVRSAAGRDKGELFFVLETRGDFLLLADGRRRRVERPKRKKRKHVEAAGAPHNRTAEKNQMRRSRTQQRAPQDPRADPRGR